MLHSPEAVPGAGRGAFSDACSRSTAHVSKRGPVPAPMACPRLGHRRRILLSPSPRFSCRSASARWRQPLDMRRMRGVAYHRRRWRAIAAVIRSTGDTVENADIGRGCRAADIVRVDSGLSRRRGPLAAALSTPRSRRPPHRGSNSSASACAASCSTSAGRAGARRACSATSPFTDASCAREPAGLIEARVIDGDRRWFSRVPPNLSDSAKSLACAGDSAEVYAARWSRASATPAVPRRPWRRQPRARRARARTHR